MIEAQNPHELVAAPSDATCALARPKLRIGVVLESWMAPAWVANVIGEIESSVFGSVYVTVLPPTRQWTGDIRHAGLLSAWVYRLYEWCDYQVFRATRDALMPVSLNHLAKTAKVIYAETRAGHNNNAWGDAALEHVKEADLDVILDFSGGEAVAGLAGCARYGVWFCRFGTSDVVGGVPTFYLELLEHHAVAETIVCCQREGHAPCMLYRGSSATDRNSLYRTQNTGAWNAGSYLVRLLQELHKFGWEYVAAGREKLTAVELRDQDSVSRLTTKSTLDLTARLLGRFLGRRVHYFFFKYGWQIVVAKHRPEAADRNDAFQVRLLAPPGRGEFADPHLFQWEGRNYLFFEYFPCDFPHGAIAYCDLDSPDTAAPVVILQPPYHVSYPFIFVWQGDIFLLLESSMNNTVELYRCTRFPDKWELDCVLMRDICAVDATLEEHGGLFWLFVGVKSPAGLLVEELSLFCADTPLGPWRSHPRNPVVTDVRRARPAGRLFHRNGRLIRPGQDCSKLYGGAITLNRVDVLTSDEYRETPIERIEPDWLPGIVANHTIDRLGCVAAIDVLGRVRSRFRWLGRRQECLSESLAGHASHIPRW